MNIYLMNIALEYLLILFVLGLVTGSFINVVIYRFPRGKSLISPPSRCPTCDHRLGPAELIPLVSYLALRGKCRHCSTRISPRYISVEVATGLLFVTVPAFKAFTFESMGFLFLLCLLLAISFIDIDFRRIPNVMLGVGLGVGIILKLIDPAARTLQAWGDAGLGMLVGGGVMMIIYIAGRGGIGAGDLKLMIMIGFFVGMPGVIKVMMIGFIIGAAYGLIMILTRRLTRKSMIPFGPFLSIGALIEIFFGEMIMSWFRGGIW